MYVGRPWWLQKTPPKPALPRFVFEPLLKLNLRKPKGGEDQKYWANGTRWVVGFTNEEEGGEMERASRMEDSGREVGQMIGPPWDGNNGFTNVFEDYFPDNCFTSWWSLEYSIVPFLPDCPLDKSWKEHLRIVENKTLKGLWMPSSDEIHNIDLRIVICLLEGDCCFPPNVLRKGVVIKNVIWMVLWNPFF